MSTDDSTSDYYLHVDLVVPEKDSAQYEDLIRRFVKEGSFRRIDPTCDDKILVLALKAASAIPFSGHLPPPGAPYQRSEASDQKVVRYVNLWRVPNLNNLDLARLMRLSGDDSLYMEIDSLVIEERQNFVVRAGWDYAAPSGSDSQNYVRSIKRFASADLGEFFFKAGALFPILKDNGWYPLGHFQSVTGTLNTVVEFWQTPTHSSAMSDWPSFFASAPEMFKTEFLGPYNELALSDYQEVFHPYLPSGLVPPMAGAA